MCEEFCTLRISWTANNLQNWIVNYVINKVEHFTRICGTKSLLKMDKKKLSIPDCISYVESNRFKIASLLNSLCYLPSIFLWHFCGKCQSKPLKEKMASSCVMWYVNWTLHNKYLLTYLKSSMIKSPSLVASLQIFYCSIFQSSWEIFL